MKKHVLLVLTLLFSYMAGHAQFYYSLNGSPINTTGWTMNSPTTFPFIDTLVLNQAAPDTAGYIYNGPTALTECAQFTVKFDFQIKDHSQQGPGHGLAFWIMDAAPTGPTTGNTMGVHQGNGFALYIDTHDDDFNPNNPLVSLLKMSATGGPNGVATYNEGLPNGRLGFVGSQTTLVDSHWHACVITYNHGAWTVSLNNSPFPQISVPAVLTPPPALTTVFDHLTGGQAYFGFSSSTGVNNRSTHSIRNVEISGANIAMPVVPPAFPTGIQICQDTVSVDPTKSLEEFVTGDSLIWYDVPVGGTPLPGAPDVSQDTTVGTCYEYYVSQYLTPDPPCGESPRDTVRVCIQSKPTAPNITYNNTYCTGVPFEPFDPFPLTGFYWYTTPVGGVGDTTTPKPSTAVPDTFLYYIARIQNGCESDRTLIPIYVLQSPTADFDSIVKLGCTADTAIFNNKSIGGSKYAWYFGDGDTSDLKDPVHIYYSQNLWDVKLIVSSGTNNCVDSITKKLPNVHELQALFDFNDDTVCQGFQIDFRDTSDYNDFGSVSFYWNFGDGDTSVLQDPFHIYNRPGMYQVVHVVTDFVPCKDTITRYFFVDSAGFMDLSIADTALCEGEMATFFGDYTTIGLKQAKWTFGDGFVAYDTNQVSHTYDSATTYTVTLSGDYRACKDTATSIQLSIRPYPAIDLGPDTTMCPNGPGIVVGDYQNQHDPNAAWLWSTGDSTSAITVRHPGIYTARVTEFGCSASDSVEIFKDCYIDIPNSFTPNNDGTNDYFLPRQLLSKSVSRFNMQVFNRWGEIVFKTDKLDGRGWDGRFNGKEQPVGAYVYLIEVELNKQTQERYQGNVTLLR